MTPSATPATEPADTSREAGESKVRSSARRINERFPRLGVMLLIAALVLVLNGITLHKVSAVSQLDEQYWVDHLVRGSHFEIEQSGDVITQEALRELCKRGFDGGASGPPCHAGHLDPRKYLPKGVNYAGHSPFYFLVTGPIARVLRASPIDLPPNDSLLTWGRLLGSAWLLLGIYLTLRAGELLGVRRSILVIALILIAATPALLHADTIVNPDATAFAAGAAVLYAGLLWERRGKGIWFVALAALIAAAFDPTNGIGIFVVLAYFALRASGRATGNDDKNDTFVRSWQEYAKVAVVIVVAAVLANRGWDRMFSFIQDNVLTRPPPIPKGKNPITHAYAVDSLSLTQLIGSQTIFSLLPPFADIALPAARSDAFYTTLAKGAELLTLVGIGAVVLRDRLTSAVSTLGFALLAALLACPTLLVIYNYVVGSTFDAPVARYGLSALPAVAIVLAAAVRTRFSELVLVAVAAGLYVSAIVVVLVA